MSNVLCYSFESIACNWKTQRKVLKYSFSVSCAMESTPPSFKRGCLPCEVIFDLLMTSFVSSLAKSREVPIRAEREKTPET